MELKVKRLTKTARVPHYHSDWASGLDLHADNDYSILPGQVMLVSTGIAVEIPYGFEGQIRPRSGLSLRFPNYIANSPGTIDSDYRGEIKIIIVNNTKDRNFVIKQGDRIAQLVITPVVWCEIEVVDELTKTKRNTSGFNSTGIR